MAVFACCCTLSRLGAAAVAVATRTLLQWRAAPIAFADKMSLRSICLPPMPCLWPQASTSSLAICAHTTCLRSSLSVHSMAPALMVRVLW